MKHDLPDFPNLLLSNLPNWKKNIKTIKSAYEKIILKYEERKMGILYNFFQT